MAEPIRLDFGTQSDPARIGFDAGPVHFNVYVAEVVEGKKAAVYYASDGFKTFATIAGGGNCRGILPLMNGLITLSGTRLVQVDTGGASTEIGGIPGTERVIMARNSKPTTPQLVITVGGQKFLVEDDGTGTLVLSLITDTDLPPANSCAFLNRRILYGINDGRMFWSDIDDAASINPLNFVTAEGKPDDLTRVFVHEQEAWLFGTETTEVWRDTGAATAPFRRNAGVVIEKGCIAPHSIVELDKDLIWLGDDGSVYAAQGYGFGRISHHGVEEIINNTVDKTAIEAFGRFRRGHHFYTLIGPDWTWELNRTTGKWFQRKSNTLDRWRVSCHTEFIGKDIVGDFQNGKIYELDDTAFDEDGQSLVWILRSAPMHAYPNQISVYRLYADFVTGVGLNDPDLHKSDPTVALRWSDDGGKTFSNEITRSLGKIGEREERVVWDHLGTTGRTGRIWEMRISSPVVRAMTYAAVEADRIGT